MTEIFCTSFNCLKRHQCKKALPIEEFKLAKPYLHTNGYCTGFVPVTEECVVTRSWLDRLIDLDWQFCK
jgi:hypothetical protein